MPLNVFTIAGELKADTTAFERSMRSAENELRQTSQKIEETEKAAKELGQTSQTVGRSFEKLRESVSQSRSRLDQAADAFKKGAINSREFAQVLNQTSNSAGRMDSKLKDSTARLQDLAQAGNKLKSSFGGGIGASFLGNLSANAIGSIADKLKDLAVEGIRLNASFDKLARYVGTVDDKLKNTAGLAQFRKELQALSLELPFSAEQFAKASYTITSGLQVFGADRVKVLQEIGKAAAAANVPVEEMADSVTGLLVGYKVPIQDLEKTFAALNSSIGKSIVTDQEYLSGLNKLAPKAIQTGQSMQTLLGAMAALTTDTKDASGAFTNLENVLSKVFDTKYEEKLNQIFGTSFFDAQGNVKQMNVLVEELGKKLEGLTPKEKSAKLGEVFKDKEARDGILALIANLDKFKKALADGADVDKFRQNQTQMLDATEARWKTFWARIEEGQKTFGERISETGFSFENTSFLGAIGTFFNNVGGLILEGFVRITGLFAKAGTSIWASFMNAFGFSTPEIVGRVQQSVSDFFDNTATSIREGTAKNNQLLKSGGVVAGSALADGLIASAGKVADAAKRQGTSIGTNLTQGTSTAINQNKGQVTTAVTNLSQVNPNPFYQSGFGAGSNLGQGLANGINSTRRIVAVASSGLYAVAEAAITIPAKIQSPSVTFMEFGQYIGEGLAIGISNQRDKVAKASTDLFKAVMATAKDVTAKIKEQVKELTKSLKDLNTENAVTVEGFTQTVGFRVSLAEGEKLKNQMQEIIDLQIKLGMNPTLNVANLDGQLSGLERLDKVVSKIKETISEPIDETSSWADMFAAFRNPDASAGLDKMAAAAGKTREELRGILNLKFWETFSDNSTRPRREAGNDNADENQGITSDFPEISALNEIVPQIKQRWEDFFATFRAGIEGMKANLPSLKESLGENLLNAIDGISDVFGNAVQNWDGTISGFFKSVAQGFGQMAKQIIADLIRLLIYKAIMKFIGSFAGGDSGGDIGAGGGGGGGGAPPGHASGGLIQGRGSSTSDSIFARLSNGEFVMKAKAVAHFGADFFQRLNNMQTPAFASGGMVGGGMMPSSSSTVNNNQRAQNFYINVSGGGSNQQNQQTASQIKRELILAMRKEEQRNK